MFLDYEVGFLSRVKKGVRNSVDFNEILEPRVSKKGAKTTLTFNNGLLKFTDFNTGLSRLGSS